MRNRVGLCKLHRLPYANSHWHGSKRTSKDPARFIAQEDFRFGGRLIPKGSEVQQFETQNFGWTFWREPNGEAHLAKE